MFVSPLFFLSCLHMVFAYGVCKWFSREELDKNTIARQKNQRLQNTFNSLWVYRHNATLDCGYKTNDESMSRWFILLMDGIHSFHLIILIDDLFVIIQLHLYDFAHALFFSFYRLLTSPLPLFLHVNIHWRIHLLTCLHLNTTNLLYIGILVYYTDLLKFQ